jgi:hypothetical protein
LSRTTLLLLLPGLLGHLHDPKRGTHAGGEIDPRGDLRRTDGPPVERHPRAHVLRRRGAARGYIDAHRAVALMEHGRGLHASETGSKRDGGEGHATHVGGELAIPAQSSDMES